MKHMRSIMVSLALSTSVSGFAGTALSSDTAVVRPVDSTLPWNRAFTVREEGREDSRTLMPLRAPDVAIPATNKWGVTVNFDLKDTTFEKMDRVSAGAYFNLSPRIRLGGSLSFSAPGELRVSTPRDRVLPGVPGDNQPAVRIESSIKF
jgi:NtrZ